MTKEDVKNLFEGIRIVEGDLGNLQGPTGIQDIETDNWVRERKRV